LALANHLDSIEEFIESHKKNPFTNKIVIDRDKIMELLFDMRSDLPTELKQAHRIIEEHDRIIADARAKAENIRRDAEIEVKSLTQNHEIYRRATEHAAEMVEEAKKDARDIRYNAMDYADEILEKTESMIREAMENIEQQSKYLTNYFSQTVDVLYDNRRQLRGD